MKTRNSALGLSRLRVKFYLQDVDGSNPIAEWQTAPLLLEETKELRSALAGEFLRIMPRGGCHVLDVDGFCSEDGLEEEILKVMGFVIEDKRCK